MDRFIHLQNLKRYRKLLTSEETTDAAMRRTLQELLADEEARDVPTLRAIWAASNAGPEG